NSLAEPRVASTGLVFLLTVPPLLSAAHGAETKVSEWPPRVVSSCVAQIGLCWVMSEIRFCGRKAFFWMLGKSRHWDHAPVSFLPGTPSRFVLIESSRLFGLIG